VLSQLPPAAEVVSAAVSGEPPSATYLNTATLTIGGTNITHYRYRVNNGAYSAQAAVGAPITLSGLADGVYTVHVIGRNAAGTWQAETDPTISRTWTVLSGLRRLVFNEVLARNDAAVNHGGTFPDLVELYNAGSATVNLQGLRLTDDLNAPNKFVFPAGASLGTGQYLVVYADDPDGTPGFHLGFALDQNGETLYLLDTAANGGRVLDTLALGLQLADRSIGRLASGQWGLCTPTFAVPTPPPHSAIPPASRSTSGSPTRPDLAGGFSSSSTTPTRCPWSCGDCILPTSPWGGPFKHAIAPLSFIPGFGYRTFVADNNPGAGPTM